MAKASFLGWFLLCFFGRLLTNNKFQACCWKSTFFQAAKHQPFLTGKELAKSLVSEPRLPGLRHNFKGSMGVSRLVVWVVGGDLFSGDFLEMLESGSKGTKN